ncbi:malonate decarboxylase acyl carrier protein [Methylocella sp.]|uniref:malonate decarboxylase acyl carrier protein n=1 Tax=Methylocella sp. TaxID=1978226 RepID=UPI0035B12878
METLCFEHETRAPARGTRRQALVGVVASGNLEALVERVLPERTCRVEIATSAHGFSDVWAAVVADFVERHSPGGLRFCVNDGGARPDTVALRLAQGVRTIEEGRP